MSSLRAALILFLASVLPAAAQQQFNLSAQSMAATDVATPTFYVGTQSGLFAAQNTFDDFRPVYITAAGSDQPDANQVFVEGTDHIYVRSESPEHVIWTSSDAGQTWTKSTNGLPAGTPIIELFLLPGNPARLLAYLRDGASGWIYSSADRGQSWTLQSTLPAGPDDFGVNLNTPDIMFVSTGRLIHRSINGGQDWASVSSAPFVVDQLNGITFLVPTPGNPMNVLLGGGGNATSQDGIFLSTDQGGSWTKVYSTVANGLLYGPDWPYYFHRPSAVTGSLALSLSGGQTWQDVQFQESSAAIRAAVPDPRNQQIVILGSSSGYHRSVNSGAAWTLISPTVTPTLGAPLDPVVFEIPQGAPARQANIRVRVVESPQWDADFTAQDPGAAWLTLQNTSGSTDDGLAISIDASGLDLGEYTADIPIRSNQTFNSEINVRVTLRVTPALSGPQPLISTYAGDGGFIDDGDGGPALEAGVSDVEDIALGPDGSLYITTGFDDVIRRVTPSGTIERFAGTGERGFSGDGGPALQAQIDRPTSIAVGPNGSVYFVDNSNRRVRMVTPQGVISTVAGNDDFSTPPPSGSDATAVGILPQAVAVDSDGVLYISSRSFGSRIYRVMSSGAYSTVADSQPATANNLAFGPDGTLYAVHGVRNQVVIVTPGGAPRPFAGSGAEGYTGDGGPALQATFNSIAGIAVGPDALYIADRDNHVIRVVDSAGNISTFAGTGAEAFSGDGGPAQFAELDSPTALAFHDSRLFLHDDGNRRVRVISFPSAQNPQFSSTSVVNAGSFALNDVAPGENISIFGSALAVDTVIATQTPLPEQLAGTSVTLTDSAGQTRPCVLFFVTGTQINCNVADQTAQGQGTLNIATPNGAASAPVPVSATAPGLFAANANGQGVAAAIAIRVAADGTQTPVDIINTAQQPFTGLPVDLGPDGDQVVLLLYGTGIRNWSDIEVTIGGVQAQVIGVAAQGQFVGLDQVNALIPRDLIGVGEVEVRMTVDGRLANVVTITVQ